VGQVVAPLHSEEDEMRYCLYAEPEWMIQSYGLNPNIVGGIISHEMLPRIFHSGLTNWGRVFEGCYHVPKSLEEYQRFDVIHVNMTPHGVGSVKRIKSDLARIDGDKPKVVVNVDHAINMWEGFGNMEWFLQDVGMADHVFCVHSVMANTLAVLLNRKVYTIPHPTDLSQFDEMREPEKFDIPTVCVMLHSYDQNCVIVTEALNALRKDRKIQVLAVGNGNRNKEYLKWNYDQYISGLPFASLMRVLSMCHVVIDTAITHSYGRIPVECAGIGTPCVSGMTVESGRILWPELQVDIFDAKSITSKIEMILFGEPPLRADIIRTAEEWVAYYGYPSCRKMFEEMLNDTN
jgi:hypothetical protein